MGLNYFVLGKCFSSYTYLGRCTAEDKEGQIVNNITKIDQQVFTSRHGWSPEAYLEIKLYLVS